MSNPFIKVEKVVTKIKELQSGSKKYYPYGSNLHITLESKDQVIIDINDQVFSKKGLKDFANDMLEVSELMVDNSYLVF